MTNDTIEALKVKEPLRVGNFGLLFWSQSYLSGKGPVDGDPDFESLLSQTWTVHYSVPSHGTCGLEINLFLPLRTDEGFENVQIYPDYLMGVISRCYNRDWNQGAKIGDLSIPTQLIRSLEELLLKWRGESLMIDYSLLPEEGNPLAIMVNFGGCRKLPRYPDAALTYIAQHLTEALA